MIARHVVIQGGGIGGLVAATALAQRGADLRLLELPVPTVQARLALPY